MVRYDPNALYTMRVLSARNPNDKVETTGFLRPHDLRGENVIYLFHYIDDLGFSRIQPVSLDEMELVGIVTDELSVAEYTDKDMRVNHDTHMLEPVVHDNMDEARLADIPDEIMPLPYGADPRNRARLPQLAVEVSYHTPESVSHMLSERAKQSLERLSRATPLFTHLDTFTLPLDGWDRRNTKQYADRANEIVCVVAEHKWVIDSYLMEHMLYMFLASNADGDAYQTRVHHAEIADDADNPWNADLKFTFRTYATERGEHQIEVSIHTWDKP